MPDALAFAVTALTTTGSGDITLPGTGRMIAVLLMIFGVTPFLRLPPGPVSPQQGPAPAPELQRDEHDPVLQVLRGGP